MRDLFEVWHYKIAAGTQPNKSELSQSAKCLGQYTSEALARSVIGRRGSEEGFRDWPYGFRIEIMPIDSGFPEPEVVSRLYSLWHFDISRDDEDDIDDFSQNPTKLGTYSSAERMQIATERFKSGEIFRDFPEGFRSDNGPPNVEYWSGGFFVWDGS